MLKYDDVSVGSTIFMIETGPVVLDMAVLDKFIKDGENRLKLRGSDLIFEINFSEVCDNTFANKDEAGAHATKYIFNTINETIRDISKKTLNDYYDLENEVKKYKELFPELFI